MPQRPIDAVELPTQYFDVAPRRRDRFAAAFAQDLVQQMMLGSVMFAGESRKHPAELRNMVTSPGGTSAEAIYQMEKGSLRTVLSKAVWAAYQRAEALGGGRKDEG